MTQAQFFSLSPFYPLFLFSLSSCEAVFNKTYPKKITDEEGEVVAIYNYNFFGDRMGKQQNFYPGGQLKNEFFLYDYLLEGPSRGWLPNGDLAYEFNYAEGKQIGRQTIWKTHGEVYKEYIIFHDGRTKNIEENPFSNPPGEPAVPFVIEEPETLNMDVVSEAIGYPLLMQDAEIEGKVVMKVLVDTAGRVMEAIPISYPHIVFVSAIEANIFALRFAPLHQNGQPIHFWTTIPFDFKLVD